MIGRYLLSIGHVYSIDCEKHCFESFEPVSVRRILVDYRHKLDPSLESILFVREVIRNSSFLPQFLEFLRPLFEELGF